MTTSNDVDGDGGGGGGGDGLPGTNAMLSNVQAAMWEELGITRKDYLPLADNDLPILNVRPLARPQSESQWANAVIADVDPASNDLDPIAGGQLYRLRRGASYGMHAAPVTRNDWNSRGEETAFSGSSLRGQASARGGYGFSTRGGRAGSGRNRSAMYDNRQHHLRISSPSESKEKPPETRFEKTIVLLRQMTGEYSPPVIQKPKKRGNGTKRVNFNDLVRSGRGDDRRRTPPPTTSRGTVFGTEATAVALYEADIPSRTALAATFSSLASRNTNIGRSKLIDANYGRLAAQESVSTPAPTFQRVLENQQQENAQPTASRERLGGQLRNSIWASPQRLPITQAAVLRAIGNKVDKMTQKKAVRSKHNGMKGHSFTSGTPNSQTIAAVRSGEGDDMVSRSMALRVPRTINQRTLSEAVQQSSQAPIVQGSVQIDSTSPTDAKEIKNRFVRLRRDGKTKDVIYRLTQEQLSQFTILHCKTADGVVVIDDVVSEVATVMVDPRNRTEVVYCAAFHDAKPVWWFVFNLPYEAENFVKLVLPGIPGGRDLINRSPEVTEHHQKLLREDLISMNLEAQNLQTSSRSSVQDIPSAQISQSVRDDLLDIQNSTNALISFDGDHAAEDLAAQKPVPRSALMDLAMLCVGMSKEVLEKMNAADDGPFLERLIAKAPELNTHSPTHEFLTSADACEAAECLVGRFFRNSQVFALLDFDEQTAFVEEIAPKLLVEALEVRDRECYLSGDIYTLDALLNLRHMAVPPSGFLFTPVRQEEIGNVMDVAEDKSLTASVVSADTLKQGPAWESGMVNVYPAQMGVTEHNTSDRQDKRDTEPGKCADSAFLDIISADITEADETGVARAAGVSPGRGPSSHIPTDSEVERLRIDLKNLSVTESIAVVSINPRVEVEASSAKVSVGGENSYQMVKENPENQDEPAELPLKNSTAAGQPDNISISNDEDMSMKRLQRGRIALSNSKYASELQKTSSQTESANAFKDRLVHPPQIHGEVLVPVFQRHRGELFTSVRGNEEPYRMALPLATILVPNPSTGYTERVTGYLENSTGPIPLHQMPIMQLSSTQNLPRSRHVPVTAFGQPHMRAFFHELGARSMDEIQPIQSIMISRAQKQEEDSARTEFRTKVHAKLGQNLAKMGNESQLPY